MTGSEQELSFVDVHTGKVIKLLKLGEHLAIISLHPNDRHLAVIGSSGVVRVWDLIRGTSRDLTGKLVRSGVAFSPDGKLLAYSSGNEIRLLNFEDGKLIKTLRYDHDDEQKRVTLIGFLADGKRIVANSHTWELLVWDVEAGGQPSIALRHVKNILFTHDEQRFKSSHGEGVVVFDAKSFERQGVLLPGESTSAYAFSPDDTRLAVGTPFGRVYVLDFPSGRKRLAPHAHTGLKLAMASSADGRLLATGERGLLRMWSLADGRMLYERKVRVGRLAFHPKSNLLAMQVTDEANWSVVVLWDADTGKDVKRWKAAKANAMPVQFTPDGRHLLCVAAGKLVLWDFESAICWDLRSEGDKPLWVNNEVGWVASQITFEPDGRRFVISAKGVWRVNAHNGRHESTPLYTRHIAWSPDGSFAVFDQRELGAVSIYHTYDEGPRVKLQQYQIGPPGSEITHLQYTPDGRHLIVANPNGTIYVLRLRKLGEPLKN